MQKRAWARGCILLGGLLIALAGSTMTVSRAQGESCAPLVEDALAAARTACANLPPETMCVGSGPVDVIQASSAPVTPPPTWPLAGLARITAGALDPARGSWGIGLLRVPGLGTGEQLTALLYGEATLINDPGPPIAPVCSAVSVGTVNIRAEPNTESAILGQLNQNESARITARLPDSSWWQIVWNGDPAWVFAQLAPADCDPATMITLNPVTGETGGGLPAPDFQGARLETGFTAPLCADGPRGGLLLQAEGESASWRVNGVPLGLDGTVLLQAGANDVLAVHVLSGRVVIETGGVSRTADTGQVLRVPLRDGVPDGVPGLPLDRVVPDAALAPVSLLPRPVTPLEANAIPAPLPQNADLACDPLPQSVIVRPGAGQTPQVRVAAAAGQTIRVSAQAAGSVQSLALQAPSAPTAQTVSENPANSGEAPRTALVADVTADETGVYLFSAVTATGDEVRFTVTCDLPAPTAPPPLQSCDATLLQWDDVAGNNVRFNAPAGATISVVAQHDLPSQGPAGTLEVLNRAGERLGQTAFVPFPDRQVAGPLDVDLPQDGVYVIRWDGDPFNIARIEALCRTPPEAEATPDEVS